MSDIQECLVAEFIEEYEDVHLGRRELERHALHENRGLVPHIRDCARSLATAGYVVLAPDLFSRIGGTGRLPSRATR